MERRSVKEASVEGVQRRMEPKKHFVFCIKVTWSDGTVNLVYRRYSRFLHVQTVLLQAFPALGGQGSRRRQFVPLPDSLTARMNIGDSIFRRMEQVNYFLKEILELESKVSQSIHVLNFLTPTPEDLEPQHRTSVKGKRKKRNQRNISGKMKGRLQKFGKTVKPWGNKISSPIVLEHFIVMEDYKKQAKSDINLKKGRAVDVIEKRECGWWLVDADGEVGWAPALYLEPADDMADCSNAMTFPIGRGEVYATTKRYVAAEEDELTFEIGVNLQILEKNYDGWWKAQYLGKEGWVPAMYLRKLGNDRRKTGRRKSRMFSTTQLRDVDDIVEEETIQEETEAQIAAEELASKNEEKKMSLPRRISHQILFKTGEQRSKENTMETVPEEGDDNTDNTLKPSSREKKKTISSMIEMSSPFVQINKDKEAQEPRPQASPRPHLKRRAISTLASTSPMLSLDSEAIKDDMSLKEKSQTLGALGSNHSNVNLSSWTPELRNKFSPGLERVRKTSAPAHIEMENRKMDFSPVANDLSPSRENVARENKKIFEGLEKFQDSDDDDDDSTSCELMQYSTSSTEIEECSVNHNGVHADSALFLKSASLGRDSPKFAPPRRNPPEPLETVTWPRNVIGPMGYSVTAQEEVYAGSEEDTSSDEGSPDEERELPRYKVPKAMESENGHHDYQENHSTTNSLRSDRSIIRQQRLEKETSEELNQEINYWSSSDESEPELAQMSLSKVVVQRETSHSPAILVEREEQSAMENNDIEEGNDDAQHSSVSSAESLGLQYIERMKSKKDNSSGEVYCSLDHYEVDGEMTLFKGDYVRVIEKAATGWWLVQNDEGLKGWAPSNFLYPILEVEDSVGCRLPDSEESFKKEDNLQRSFYAIEEYMGDADNQEISLRKGELAHVVHKSESGWWCVRNEDGEVGWAPSTYLEELTNNNDTVFVN